MAQSCGTCSRGWKNMKGTISCGAAVDQDAFIGDNTGVNPIWAERKYGQRRLLAILLNDVSGAAEPEGSNCEDLDFSDGIQCKMWRNEEVKYA